MVKRSVFVWLEREYEFGENGLGIPNKGAQLYKRFERLLRKHPKKFTFSFPTC